MVQYSSGATTTVSTRGNIRKGKRQDTIVSMPEVYEGFIAPWGDDNLWPQNVVKKIDESNVIGTCIDWKADAITAEGVAYGYQEIVDGKERLVRIQDNEVDEFLEMNNSQQFFEEAALDTFSFANRYGQITLNESGTKVAQIYSHDATECRLSIQDENDGSIPFCAISANWDSGESLDYRMILPALDPYYDIAGQLKQKAGKHKAFILPQRKMRNGRKWYDKPTWYGFVESGWFDVAKEIPKYKLHRMRDELKVRYHVQFHERYFLQKYKGFADLSEEDQIKKYNEEVAVFIESLTGNDENSGLIFSFFGTNRLENSEIPSMKITPIASEKISGELLEDSQESDFQAIRPFGIHPKLVGVNGKTGLGAGSGSDQREAWNNFILRSKGVQNSLLREHIAAARFNGWNKKTGGKPFHFWFERYYSVTMDEGVDNKKLNPNGSTD